MKHVGQLFDPEVKLKNIKDFVGSARKRQLLREANQIEMGSDGQKVMKPIVCAPKKKESNTGGKDLVIQNIPKITSCVWLKQYRILVICFIDRRVKLFKIQGLSDTNELEMTELDEWYRCPFIVEHSVMGNHKLS